MNWLDNGGSMKTNKSTYLGFKGYEVINMNMNKVTETDNSEADRIGFMFKIIPNDKKILSKVNIIQGVKISASKNFPYEIEVVIKGNFELGNNSTYEEKVHLLMTNASAILFPYLRATVSLLSSQLEFEKILLPVINFSTIFQTTDTDTLLIEPTQFEDFN